MFVTLATALALLVSAVPARADGDPASDFLPFKDVFFPYLNSPIKPELRAQLTALVAEAKKRHYRIKVALIAKPYDLGAVTALWMKPAEYAHFLAQELVFLYRGRLLIVMPNGFGIYDLGDSTASERAVLSKLKTESSPDGLAQSAITAVQELAAADGVKLNPPQPQSVGDDTNRDRLIIIGAVAGAMLVLAAARLLVRQRAKRPRIGR